MTNIPQKIYTVISEEQSEEDRSLKRNLSYIGDDPEKAKEVMSQRIKDYKEKLITEEHINPDDWTESWNEEQYQTIYKGFTEKGKYFWHQVSLTENIPVPQSFFEKH